MSDTLKIVTDSAEAEFAVTEGTIRATELRQFATPDGPLASFDPGLMNTAACRSAITYIDGDAGILELSLIHI